MAARPSSGNVAFRVRFEYLKRRRKKERKERLVRGWIYIFDSRKGEGCESESQKFFIESRISECIDKCTNSRKKVKVKEGSYINLART